MPHILPPPEHPDVVWPSNEGVIGVVGVAPWATLEFCRKVYELAPATKDWHYPRLIIDANSKIPSRGRHLELAERDPSPFINATINELASAGATIAVIPCNTAHILFERWSTPSKIHVLNIIDATVIKIPSSHQTVALLASHYLADSQIYQKALTRAGYQVAMLLPDEQVLISKVISQLKRFPILPPDMLEALDALKERLRQIGVSSVILACTELSIFSEHPLWAPLHVVDSNTALAAAALKEISLNLLH